MKFYSLILLLLFSINLTNAFAIDDEIPSFSSEDIESNGRAGRIFREMYGEYSERAEQIKRLKEKYPDNKVVDDLFKSFKDFDRAFKTNAKKKHPGELARKYIQSQFSMLDYSMKLILATEEERCSEETRTASTSSTNRTRGSTSRALTTESRQPASISERFSLEDDLRTQSTGVR